MEVEFKNFDRFNLDHTLGGPTVIQNLTDSTHNQNLALLVLQNTKSKISEKSDQN